MLVFQVNEIGDGFDESKVVYFRMHEYSHGDLVLCKITFDVSKNPLLSCRPKSPILFRKVAIKGPKRKKQSNKNLETTASSTTKSVNASECSEGLCFDEEISFESTDVQNFPQEEELLQDRTICCTAKKVCF